MGITTEVTMTSLLNFIIRYCSRLFGKHGFRFKDSKVGQHPAAGSSILLESNDVQIYICDERDQITLQMRSMHDSKKRNWFSFDLISQLLGRQAATGVMDPANATFLSDNIDEIIGRFRANQLSETLNELNRLKAERTKRT